MLNIAANVPVASRAHGPRRKRSKCKHPPPLTSQALTQACPPGWLSPLQPDLQVRNKLREARLLPQPHSPQGPPSSRVFGDETETEKCLFICEVARPLDGPDPSTPEDARTPRLRHPLSLPQGASRAFGIPEPRRPAGLGGNGIPEEAWCMPEPDGAEGRQAAGQSWTQPGSGAVIPGDEASHWGMSEGLSHCWANLAWPGRGSETKAGRSPRFCSLPIFSLGLKAPKQGSFKALTFSVWVSRGCLDS